MPSLSKIAPIVVAAGVLLACLGMWLDPVSVTIGKREVGTASEIGYALKVGGSILAFAAMIVALAGFGEARPDEDRDGE